MKIPGQNFESEMGPPPPGPPGALPERTSTCLTERAAHNDVLLSVGGGADGHCLKGGGRGGRFQEERAGAVARPGAHVARGMGGECPAAHTRAVAVRTQG